jgi:DNA-binding NarL/FixJ family response regulator
MSSRARESILAVVVANPHRDERERICALVDGEPDLHVIAVASCREDGAQLLWELDPDAAVIEVGLLSACEFPLHGWGLVPRRIRLVAVGFGEDPWLASTLSAAGFAAYLPEARLADELCDALRGPRDPARLARTPTTAAALGSPARFARTRAPSAGPAG